MRVLVIGPGQRTKIARLREKAAALPISRETMVRGAALATVDPRGHVSGEPVFDARAFTIKVPFGYRVTYTIEQQPKGACRHLSVSVAAAGNAPNELAMRELMKEFGFVNDLEHAMTWVEDTEPGRVAVNVVDPVDGDWEPHRRKLGEQDA